jgi:H+/gluconate symporter-like permease
MLREANAGLADEFSVLFGKLALGTGIVGILLVIAGYLLLFLFSRKKNAETAESET